MAEPEATQKHRKCAQCPLLVKSDEIKGRIGLIIKQMTSGEHKVNDGEREQV